MDGTIIAVIADCDDTLAPDTTGQLLEKFGVDVDQFWQQRVAPLVDAGWDPTLAYLCEMLALVEEGPLETLTEAKMREIGPQLQLYPGVPEVFSALREEIEGDLRYQEHHITVEYYVISGGIKDLIQASPLGEAVSWMWGCNFSYDDNGRIAFPRRVVSFTEKTRFLFNIQKGFTGESHRNRPYAVNAPMKEERRRVPFENMLYLGDGPSDVPCMSLLMKAGGRVLGVSCPMDPLRIWTIGYGRRAHATVAPNYRKGSDTYETLKVALRGMASDIAGRIEYEQGRLLPPIP
ncbi:MAG: hydrolase [Chloroflexi bacterium B3_Chlor]|nr:MAG: hydrolase [Chloroflexi bacterium B3_Chlor]